MPEGMDVTIAFTKRLDKRLNIEIRTDGGTDIADKVERLIFYLADGVVISQEMLFYDGSEWIANYI